MKKLTSFIAKTIVLSFFFLAVAPVAVPLLLSDASAAAGAGGEEEEAAGSITTTSATPNDNALVNTMCNAMQLVTGNAGKAFAGFAIISLGIGFFTGKISWGLMIGVAMGIAAMFGAPTVVAALSGGSAADCGSTQLT